MPSALQNVQSWAPFMLKVSDAGLPPGQALPNFAYRQHNHEPAAILNEDITIMEVQQQLDCLHNGRASGQAVQPAEPLRYAKEAAQPGQPAPPYCFAKE